MITANVPGIKVRMSVIRYFREPFREIKMKNPIFLGEGWVYLTPSNMKWVGKEQIQDSVVTVLQTKTSNDYDIGNEP